MTNYFIVFATDKPDLGELRGRIRPRHRDYLRAIADHGVRVYFGGPTLDSQGGAMNGTLLVVEAVNYDTVLKFVENDPYMQSGLFERVEIRGWNWSLGNPEQQD